jgi:hypothetical protein
MRSQSKALFATARRHFGGQTLALGAAFLILLAVSIVVGADGLLEHFKVLAGRPGITLEAGAALFLVSAAAFLAMGMSVSAEAMAREKAGER